MYTFTITYLYDDWNISLFSGTFTALITPFSPVGQEVDYEKLREIVEWQIEQGIDGLVPVSMYLHILTYYT